MDQPTPPIHGLARSRSSPAAVVASAGQRRSSSPLTGPIVVAVDIDEASAADTATMVRDFGSHATSARCDVTDVDDVRKALGRVFDEYERA